MFKPRPVPDPIQAGEESVWNYPRPPAIEQEAREIVITFHGEELARTTRAVRILEESHPPVYYLPPEDVRIEHLIPNNNGSYCEWKGRNTGYDLRWPGKPPVMRAGWAYLDPHPRYAAMKGHIAFYAKHGLECTVGGERAEPQPGNYYGGWVTSWVKGPFKGEPGTMGW